jgi:hypothetical protein
MILYANGSFRFPNCYSVFALSHGIILAPTASESVWTECLKTYAVFLQSIRGTHKVEVEFMNINHWIYSTDLDIMLYLCRRGIRTQNCLSNFILVLNDQFI